MKNMFEKGCLVQRPQVFACRSKDHYRATLDMEFNTTGSALQKEMWIRFIETLNRGKNRSYISRCHASIPPSEMAFIPGMITRGYGELHKSNFNAAVGTFCQV